MSDSMKAALAGRSPKKQRTGAGNASLAPQTKRLTVDVAPETLTGMRIAAAQRGTTMKAMLAAFADLVASGDPDALKIADQAPVGE